MDDDELSVSAPMTPREADVLPVVSQEDVDPVRTFSTTPGTDREEYILQLEDQLKELRDTVQQLRHQQQAQTIQPQVQHFVGILLPEYWDTTRLAGSCSQAFTLANSVEGNVKTCEKREKGKVVAQKSKQDRSSSQSRRKGRRNQNQIRRFPVDSVSLGSSASTGQRSRWCPRCRAAHVGPCTPQTIRCIQCGEIGHEAKNCRFPRGVCWNCHIEGHRTGECPYAKRMESKVGTGTSTTGGSVPVSQKRKNPPTPEGRTFCATVEDATTLEDVITGNERNSVNKNTEFEG